MLTDALCHLSIGQFFHIFFLVHLIHEDLSTSWHEFNCSLVLQNLLLISEVEPQVLINVVFEDPEQALSCIWLEILEIFHVEQGAKHMLEEGFSEVDLEQPVFFHGLTNQNAEFVEHLEVVGHKIGESRGLEGQSIDIQLEKTQPRV